ncbi:MED6-domain-containing protein [Rhizodiscina lignyota]|uniref:Mediator of RNA polymerase II transcription subunit 6 n=1 Tax=Rhizodiscina lignyota TaxID=1504668 RepID=A0A9P4I8N1_9PEZI|nr:MED6-domain-containing protein [Rhizodiscina lignyota]
MAEANEIDLSQYPWRNNEAIAFYKGIANHNVHLYFMNSHFFDPTSNNGVLKTQSQYQAGLEELVRKRDTFEARLRTMAGVEYVVVEEPPEGKEMLNPVWVIRKQERRKEQGKEDELRLLGTYYVVGENIWQAPSIADILKSRMLSITSAMTSFFSLASSLPLYSPVQGHYYLSPSAILSAKKAAGTESRGQSLDPGTPVPSVANSVSGAKALQDTDDDLRLLGESLRLTAAHGSEYMDENPLRGEPGNFVFASSTEHLRAQQQAQQAKAQAAAAAAVSAASSLPSRTNTPLPEIKTQGLEQAKKGLKGGEKSPVSAGPPKLKRKKTGKAPGDTSPT